MDPAAAVLAWGGPALHAGAWLAVRAGRSIWVATAVVLGPLGALSLLLAPPEAAARTSLPAAALLGLGAGVALYAATAGFMFVARRLPVLGRHAAALYERRAGMPLSAALALAALVVAPGEELLWRGVVQERLAAALGSSPGALVAWGAYVAVNAIGGSVPILLGAAVGGAAWGALALATGGVAAPIVCHAVWTALMIVLPPVFAPGSGR